MKTTENVMINVKSMRNIQKNQMQDLLKKFNDKKVNKDRINRSAVPGRARGWQAQMCRCRPDVVHHVELEAAGGVDYHSC